jgi:hypothetical protein
MGAYMLKIKVSPVGWVDYMGSKLRYQPELDRFLIRRAGNVYFAKSLRDAQIVAEALEILDDPDNALLRKAISEGQSLASASCRSSSASKH